LQRFTEQHLIPEEELLDIYNAMDSHLSTACSSIERCKYLREFKEMLPV
jgi:hypothetical protein